MKRRFAILVASIWASVGAGCGEPERQPAGGPASGKSAPAGDAAPPRFEERAEAAGLRFKMAFIPTEQGEKFKVNLYDHGCGVAVADYDGDGRDDVYFCNQLGPNALFHNEGGGNFKDVTASTGANVGVGDRICVGASFGDYDNDGRPDLFVASTRGGNLLFRNEGGGKFTDVTEKAGVGFVAHSMSGTFFDADRDGWLDLLVANTAKWTNEQYDEAQHHYPGPETLFDLKDRPKEKNVFYRNRGDGTFADATEASGLGGHGWNSECAVFDYDGDGFLDVFLSSMFGRTTLYRNDGRGKFVDVTIEVLDRVSYCSQGVRAFDYDVDGDLDLMIADMHSDMWGPPVIKAEHVEEKRKYGVVYGPMVKLNLMTPAQADDLASRVRADTVKAPIFGNTLYRNQGDGKFEEVSEAAGVETFWPWGVLPADFRNIGREDVFLPSGMGYPFFYWPNRYLLNRGDGTFVESAAAAGLDPPPGGIHLDARDYGGRQATKSSRTAATGDFDQDGRVDLVVSNFNDRAFLYMNRTPQRAWIGLRLKGTKSARDAIGAFVTLRAGGTTQVRLQQAAGGYLSQSSSTLHFGLGDATSIERCDVRWPSGSVQSVEGLAPGRVHDVVER
jgi:hypothetical protein